MFLEVLATLLKVMSAFAVLLLCFAVTFYVIFTTIIHEDFKVFHESSLKVMIMLMGELDYSGFRHRTELLTMGMEYVAIGVFIVFCVTVSLVVNNLLIGLAVGDIEAVRKKAEINLVSLQASQIAETREKLICKMFRRRFYVKTLTEMPNRHDLHSKHRHRKHVNVIARMYRAIVRKRAELK
ncbi:transient receptor potential cation channel subfamily A member 1-like [Xenia sp. Carnegie-2017]|uniref:transient receptor potential cation channel subfamily A member 1-like n=1 Tax=Xenia sp. Carnegie-2017 TaxID=2897299 RepID=UPI001F04AAC1|nr:transient receptor potential cation channel subfamily A member 1-like [Xenia sp. Carnegie-2017]